jgi:hypothetical protein
MDKFSAESQEYEGLLQKNLEWHRCATEPGLRLEKELTDTRITMEHVLYAMELGKIVDGDDARAHIMRFVVQHPKAPDAMIVAYLDAKGIWLPTKKWKAVVERKYGCGLWKYSWEGDLINGIAADEKIRHRTRQYLWRYKKMAIDLRALYEIKRMLKLRKLQLPEIAA